MNLSKDFYCDSIAMETKIMKNTGIVRRVDDLGRIVLPKEIRRRARIREDDPMEIFIENGKVILSKYSPMEEMTEIRFMLRGFYKNLKCPILVCDRERVVQLVQPPQGIEKGQPVTSELLELILDRKAILHTGEASAFHPIDGSAVSTHVLVSQPIILDNMDVCGAVLLLATGTTPETADDNMVFGAKMIADAIAEYLNI